MAAGTIAGTTRTMRRGGESMADDQEYGGPWLMGAFFCEKILTEKDGVLSAIRLVDRITVTASGPGAPEKMPPSTISVTAHIGFKAGFFRGSREAKLVAHNPSQAILATTVLPMFFEGEDRGATAVLPMTVVFREEGLYWFDVLLGERLVTRMPLRVIYQRVTAGPGQAPGQQG